VQSYVPVIVVRVLNAEQINEIIHTWSALPNYFKTSNHSPFILNAIPNIITFRCRDFSYS